jgi:hypothetical protein
MFCEHNEKLASRGRKKIKKSVTLIFYFFDAESLATFYVTYIYNKWKQKVAQ